jgi:hypothetical protein
MRLVKKYFILRYFLPSNFHQKLHTAPYEPFRPRSISSGNFVKIKGKVVPVLLTEHYAMKTYWRNG